MTPGFALFVGVLAILQVVLPRRFAFLPLVIGAAHAGNREILGELTTARLLIGLGLSRALFTGSFVFNGRLLADKLMVAIAFFALISAIGHNWVEGNPWISRVGLILNIVGSYLYGRAYIYDLNSFKTFVVALPIILLPLAISMQVEKTLRRNAYYFLGSGTLVPLERDDRIRAQGPFRHAILAGCCGATALPLAILLWVQRRRKLAVTGIISSLAIVVACASSGPLAAVAVTVGSVLIWRYRSRMKLFLIASLCFAAFYWVVAGRGPWYIMASIDLVGGSTGWHRAKLFDQGFHYLSDWWLFGTDYTRHWMATGVSWSQDHVDLTNYYLHLGVMCGLSVPLLLALTIFSSLRDLYRCVMETGVYSSDLAMIPWFLGATICTHMISFVSISYFDQMYVFFYISLAAVPAVISGCYRELASGEMHE